ncbi:MAG: FAD-dependent oxidoreductase, partial [Spirochaetaceae bacterium]
GADAKTDTDILVYGATSAGVIAAVKAARLGHRVILAHPGRFVGGMTSGGLTYTDLGNKAVIGGLAREVYRRIGRHYGKDEAWTFEPSVAEAVFHDMLSEAGVTPRFNLYVDAVRLAGGPGSAIREVSFRGGLTVSAKWCVDATYEGDLMALAGVPYATGRESNEEYGETYNGAQIREHHQFDCEVSPYRVAGDPASGLLPFIVPEGTAYEQGAADPLVQAYNFRVCMTDNPENRVPFPKPAGYDPEWYELAARWLSCTSARVFEKFDRVTPEKTDTNNFGAVSTDFIGGNWEWPDASYEKREEIFQNHVRWQQGLHWFMANDERVPEEIRREYATWGLAADEFTQTGNWPHQLYVREARRMVGDYVISDRDCLSERRCEDPVGMGAYNMDSHNCRRIVIDGVVRNDGDVQIKLPRPYGISWRAIVPPRGSCTNLAVPVCASTTHIAFGSLRMEPVFMILAESAIEGIDLADAAGINLQDVSWPLLQERLDAAGQIYETDIVNDRSGNPTADD